MGSTDASSGHPGKLQAEGDAPPSESRITVEVTQQFTEKHPGEVTIVFVNKSDIRRSIWFGPTPPFAGYIGKHEKIGARLLLIPKTQTGPAPRRPGIDEFTPKRPENGCWRAKSELVYTPIKKEVEFEPQEEIATEYVLLAHPANEGCIPIGKYRFEESNYRDDMSWGFSLSVQASQDAPG